MCVTVFMADERREITSINELLSVVPLDMLVLDDGYSEPGESKAETVARIGESCLCPVNIEASFLGLKKWKLEHDEIGDWIVRSVPQTHPTP